MLAMRKQRIHRQTERKEMKPSIFTFFTYVNALVLIAFIMLDAPQKTLVFTAWVCLGFMFADMIHQAQK
jgi:hypothetical protein